MPVETKSGECLRIRKQSNLDSWYQRRCNAEVFLQGVGWIAVYMHSSQLRALLEPGNTVRQGCSIKCTYGKWSASVKIIKRVVSHSRPADHSVVGIDPGLAVLATTSDQDVLPNPRNLKYANARDLALSIIDSMPSSDTKTTLREEIYRQEARQDRRVHTQARQFAADLSKRYEFIGVEENHGIAIGKGSRYTGITKTLMRYLIERCGSDRVYEVSSSLNSQICSGCGHHSKETWERVLGQKEQICTCPACGLTLDRDVNSACNVKNRLLKLLHLPCGG